MEEIPPTFAQRVHLAIYLGPKVVIWKPLWALSIYYIATWTLWVGVGFRVVVLKVWTSALRGSGDLVSRVRSNRTRGAKLLEASNTYR